MTVKSNQYLLYTLNENINLQNNALQNSFSTYLYNHFFFLILKSNQYLLYTIDEIIHFQNDFSRF